MASISKKKEGKVELPKREEAVEEIDKAAVENEVQEVKASEPDLQTLEMMKKLEDAQAGRDLNEIPLSDNYWKVKEEVDRFLSK